jgi:hypothetical protein
MTIEKGAWNSSEASDYNVNRPKPEHCNLNRPTANSSNNYSKNLRRSRNCPQEKKDIKQIFRNRNFEFIN